MAFNKPAWQRRWQAVDSSNETAGPGGPAQTWGSAPLTSQLLRWRTAREASTRHARVRAPHLPVSQCEVILAAVLSGKDPASTLPGESVRWCQIRCRRRHRSPSGYGHKIGKASCRESLELTVNAGYLP